MWKICESRGCFRLLRKKKVLISSFFYIYNNPISNPLIKFIFINYRFSKGGGVTQPSQRRYVGYFGELLKNWKKTPMVKYLNSIVLNGIPHFSGSEGCRPYIEIYNVLENKMVYFYSIK